MNNLDLALEYTKKYQKCRESGVSEDNAVLAVLHDLADLKDKELIEKLSRQNEKKFEEYVKSYAKVLGDDVDIEFLLATAKEMLSKISLDFNEK